MNRNRPRKSTTTDNTHINDDIAVPTLSDGSNHPFPTLPGHDSDGDIVVEDSQPQSPAHSSQSTHINQALTFIPSPTQSLRNLSEPLAGTSASTSNKNNNISTATSRQDNDRCASSLPRMMESDNSVIRVQDGVRSSMRLPLNPPSSVPTDPRRRPKSSEGQSMTLASTSDTTGHARHERFGPLFMPDDVNDGGPTDGRGQDALMNNDNNHGNNDKDDDQVGETQNHYTQATVAPPTHPHSRKSGIKHLEEASRHRKSEVVAGESLPTQKKRGRPKGSIKSKEATPIPPPSGRRARDSAPPEGSRRSSRQPARAMYGIATTFALEDLGYFVQYAKDQMQHGLHRIHIDDTATHPRLKCINAPPFSKDKDEKLPSINEAGGRVTINCSARFAASAEGITDKRGRQIGVHWRVEEAGAVHNSACMNYMLKPSSKSLPTMELDLEEFVRTHLEDHLDFMPKTKALRSSIHRQRKKPRDSGFDDPANGSPSSPNRSNGDDESDEGEDAHHDLRDFTASNRRAQASSSGEPSTSNIPAQRKASRPHKDAELPLVKARRVANYARRTGGAPKAAARAPREEAADSDESNESDADVQDTSSKRIRTQQIVIQKATLHVEIVGSTRPEAIGRLEMKDVALPARIKELLTVVGVKTFKDIPDLSAHDTLPFLTYLAEKHDAIQGDAGLIREAIQLFTASRQMTRGLLQDDVVDDGGDIDDAAPLPDNDNDLDKENVHQDDIDEDLDVSNNKLAPTILASDSRNDVEGLIRARLSSVEN